MDNLLERDQRDTGSEQLRLCGPLLVHPWTTEMKGLHRAETIKLTNQDEDTDVPAGPEEVSWQKEDKRKSSDPGVNASHWGVMV